MTHSKEVYVFDFDDTLFWSEEWHGMVRINKDGIVIGPGKSKAIKNALDFFDDCGENLFLKADEAPAVSGRPLFFSVRKGDGKHVSIEEVCSILTREQMNDACISLSKKYSPYASISDDNTFYLNPDTVGGRGANEEMLSLYSRHHAEAFILTARRGVPGMIESISSCFAEIEMPPKSIYVQPVVSESSSKFKANVLLSIASDPKVEVVHFYDDYLPYLNGIRDTFESSNADFTDKIILNHASPEKKELSPFMMAREIASILGDNYYLSKFGFVEKALEDIYAEEGSQNQ